MQSLRVKDILDRKTEEHVEQLADLLLSIANEVLVSRPYSITRYLAEHLISRVDKRTLWLMQMESYLADCSNAKASSDSEEHSSVHQSAGKNIDESYLSYLRRKKAAREREVRREESVGPLSNSNDSMCKSPAKKRKESHCDFSDFKGSEGSKGARRSHEKLVKRPNFNSHSQIGNSPQKESLQKTNKEEREDSTGLPSDATDRGRDRQERESADQGEDRTAYKKVASSINVLIDIEKEFKKCGSEYGVYKLLKTSKVRSPEAERDPCERDGILESSCLRPSVFKRLLEEGKRAPCRAPPSKRNDSEDDCSAGLSLFAVTGTPIGRSDEPARNMERPAKSGERVCCSDGSSTSILSTYEYNKNLASSSTECLLGHPKQSERSLTHDKSNTSVKNSSTSFVVDDAAMAATGEETSDAGRARPDDDGAPAKDIGDKCSPSDSKANGNELDLGTTFGRKDSSSLGHHVSLYRCPEQCDFFRTEDPGNGPPFRFVGSFAPASRTASDKKPRRNMSDTDAIAPDWTEYCLGLTPPSLSAHLLSTTRVAPACGPRESESTERMESVRCRPSWSNNARGESTEREPREAKRETVTGFEAQATSSSPKSYLIVGESFERTDPSLAGVEASTAMAAAAASDGRSDVLECSFDREGGQPGSDVKSMPCPSLYYKTTWLESNCSLEFPLDLSAGTGITQGWISIEEDHPFGGSRVHSYREEGANRCGVESEPAEESADARPIRTGVAEHVGDENFTDEIVKRDDLDRPNQSTPVPLRGSVASKAFCELPATGNPEKFDGDQMDASWTGQRLGRKRHAQLFPEHGAGAPELRLAEDEAVEQDSPVLFETDL